MSASFRRPLAGTIRKIFLAAALFAMGCSQPSSASNWQVAPARLPTGWQLVELNNEPVSSEPAPTLSLSREEGRLSGFAGVNQFSAEVVAEGDSLKVGPIRSTKMAGPPERMALEERYLDALAQATAWRMHDQRLALLAGNARHLHHRSAANRASTRSPASRGIR